MNNEKETLFKNTVGRPTNEIKKKRKIFILVISLVVLVAIVGVVLIFNINNAKRGSTSSKLRTEKLETTKPEEIDGKDSTSAPSNLKLYCVANIGGSESNKITTISLNKEFYCYTDDESGINMEADMIGLASGYDSSLITVKGNYWIRLKYTTGGIKTINASIGNIMAKVDINVTSDNNENSGDGNENTTTTKTNTKTTTKSSTKTTTKSTTKTTTKTTTTKTTTRTTTSESSDSKTISGVIRFNQYPNYPAGCEPISLYILLRYYNVSVTADTVMDSVPKNGTPYVDDPNEKFLGDPRSNSGWGIYEEALARVANQFKPNIINGTGMNFSRIYELINSNRPVIVWTFDWTSGRINWDNEGNISGYTTRTWESNSGTVTWISPNHAVVVIGYDKDNVIISDPIDGKIKGIPKKTFENAYNIKGKKALYY